MAEIGALMVNRAVPATAIGDDRAHLVALHACQHVGRRVRSLAAVPGLLVVVQVGVEEGAGVGSGDGGGESQECREAEQPDALGPGGLNRSLQHR